MLNELTEYIKSYIENIAFFSLCIAAVIVQQSPSLPDTYSYDNNTKTLPALKTC